MEEEHLSPLKATKKAMHEIAGANSYYVLNGCGFYSSCLYVWSSGVFYRQFAITMATAIILSGIVALTLTPALCAIMLRNNHGKAKKKTPINRFVMVLITRLTCSR
jgi:HAE1 family hydrophobic/amphiphilic exporter-1